MIDMQYWKSLWGIIIFIGFFIFFISISVMIFSFIYEHLSLFTFWDSPIWLKIKIPLIILGIICFLAAVIAYSRYSGQKELKAAQEYAETQGWSFTRYPPEDLNRVVSRILSSLKYEMYYIRTVENGKRNIYLFDCSYKSVDATRGSYSYGTACLVLSDKFMSVTKPLDIEARDWTEVMISDKVKLGESPFSQKFIIQSKDHESAKIIVNESTQPILLEHLQSSIFNPVSVTIGTGGAVIMTGTTAEHERLQDLIKLARRIEEAIN